MQNCRPKFKIRNIIIRINQQSTITNQQQYNGFTLIEVIVAATIIALLSTLGISGYQAATRSGRDALRKSDLEQVRSALEIYKSENGSYPALATTCVPTLSSSYINTYPTDSKNPTYNYCYNRVSNLNYSLCAHLENGGATDYNAANQCGGANFCTSNCNYMVSNP